MKIPAELWREVQDLEIKLRAIPHANFLELIAAAGLDMEKDVVGNDWRNVHFDNLDLRKLDFRNTRLFKCSWNNAKVSGVSFVGSNVQDTPFHLASDWREAVLTEEQRAVLELKHSLSSDELPSLSDIESLEDRSFINAAQWVALIKNSKNFEEAHAVYRLMTREGKGANKAALTTLLDKAEKQNQSDVGIVDAYFAAMPQIEFDAFALATRLSKVQNGKEAIEIFNRYKNSVTRTQYVYNAFLANFDFYEAADSVFKQMQEDGFGVDSVSLNKLIWNAATFEGAQWIYQKVPEPRSLDLTALMSHAKWRDFQPEGKAYGYLSGVPLPDEVTFNVMIPNCETFDNGVQLYKIMRENKITPSSKTAYPLLKLIIPYEDTAVDRAFNLLTIMIRDGADINKLDVLNLLKRIIAWRYSTGYKKIENDIDKFENIRDIFVFLAREFATKKVSFEFQCEFEKLNR